MILSLKVPLDAQIARAIYTSIAFDTQLFRYVRNSPDSHLICAELLKYEKNPAEVHRHLFGSHTVEKMIFLSKALGDIEYFCNGRLALLKLRSQDMLDHQLEMDDSRDVVDMVMNIESLEAAALLREDGPNEYKLSLRSKGRLEVLSMAEELGGGGHLFAAGAYLRGQYETMKADILKHMIGLLDRQDGNGSKPTKKE